MKDLSREEKLRQQLLEKAYEYGDKKWMRVKRTFFILSGIIYLPLFYAILKGEISGIKDIFYVLIGTPVFAGFIMFIAYGILFYIIDGAMKYEKDLAELKGRLDEIEFNKYSGHEDEKTKEIKLQLEHLKDLLEITFDECNLEFDGDFENEEDEEKEEIEIIKNQLESLKDLVKLIETEYKYLKLIKVFDDEVE